MSGLPFSLGLTASSNFSGSNDFVKKLFQMLQEDGYKDVVRWTHNGDSFVVLNTNEFTKEILPRHFKHSNFASFVRQLNKYDFHKVKVSTEEKQNYPYGEDAWEFKHPDFRINDLDSLENIKRKGPSNKKGPSVNGAEASLAPLNSGQSISHISANQQYMKEQIEYLQADNKALQKEISVLQTKYKTIIESIVALNTVDERYHRSMNILINCLVQAGIKLPPLDFPNPSLVSLQVPQHNLLPSLSGQLPQVFTTNLVNPKFHVLLVEDDNVCIQLCRKFLVKYGCQVTVATDGLNAISTVEHTKYDLVLMDIVMPNLDGATATSVIRSFDTKTPIIAMTGNIEDNDLVNYLQNGMSDILAKPFTKDDLYSILAKHLLTDEMKAANNNGSAEPTTNISDTANSKANPSPGLNTLQPGQQDIILTQPIKQDPEVVAKKQRLL
ncbi:response regulator [Suhomyces tanzawaensis NRRL Y-17324]|uniref:Transcription factor n=1 Tax=Suhomyces tanzawaensis NRRL Y-17324 TaxID=984487 RepID=A0A1E4SPW9_9ASCO|nr:response regulator [Suhomyces tanzawaensis NRRL Y-17324]ODV81563.1 response regulator [Suhomyces tanzawaensis NRRL Y-17324]